MFSKINSFINKFWSVFDFNFIPKVKSIMNAGIRISFILVLFATLLMAIYISTNPSYILYDLGITLFKTFTMFMVMFFINGIAFNKIVKDSH